MGAQRLQHSGEVSKVPTALGELFRIVDGSLRVSVTNDKETDCVKTDRYHINGLASPGSHREAIGAEKTGRLSRDCPIPCSVAWVAVQITMCGANDPDV